MLPPLRCLLSVLTLLFVVTLSQTTFGQSVQILRSGGIQLDRNVASAAVVDVVNNRKANLKGLFDVNLNVLGQIAGPGGANAGVIGGGHAGAIGGNGNGNFLLLPGHGHGHHRPGHGHVHPTLPTPRPYPYPYPAPSIPSNSIHQIGGPGSANSGVIGGGSAFSRGGNANGNQFLLPRHHHLPIMPRY